MPWLKEFLKPELIWFLVGFVLVLCELVIPGLVIVFFAVGAWVVAAVCLVSDPSLNVQLGVFIVSSALSLLVARRWVKSVFKGFGAAKQDMNVDMDDFVGQRAVVTKAIAPGTPGKVEFHGTDWNAEAQEEIGVGVSVEIIQKDNLTFNVKTV